MESRVCHAVRFVLLIQDYRVQVRQLKVRGNVTDMLMHHMLGRYALSPELTS